MTTYDECMRVWKYIVAGADINGDGKVDHCEDVIFM